MQSFTFSPKRFGFLEEGLSNFVSNPNGIPKPDSTEGLLVESYV